MAITSSAYDPLSAEDRLKKRTRGICTLQCRSCKSHVIAHITPSIDRKIENLLPITYENLYSSCPVPSKIRLEVSYLVDYNCSHCGYKEERAWKEPMFKLLYE